MTVLYREGVAAGVEKNSSKKPQFHKYQKGYCYNENDNTGGQYADSDKIPAFLLRYLEYVVTWEKEDTVNEEIYEIDAPSRQGWRLWYCDKNPYNYHDRGRQKSHEEIEYFVMRNRRGRRWGRVCHH